MEAPAASRLTKVTSRFPKARILVVGDLILDEFVWGSVTRISPEAPVPVVWVEQESHMPGGASNVASNIRSLGGKVYLCGVIGKDESGGILTAELRKGGIDIEGVFIDETRPTSLKTRVVAHHQQVVRIDREQVRPIIPSITKQISDYVHERMSEVDGIVIEDYGKGVIVPQLLRSILGRARRQHKVIMVDPKEEHFSYYTGVTAITPNQQEAQGACGIKITDRDSLLRVGQRLLKRLRCQAVLITRGEHGMSLFESNGKVTQIPTVAQEVFDVSGAGDTVIATFTIAKAAGASMVEAAHISNFAAGIVVGKIGIATVSPEELRHRLTNHRWQAP